MSKTPHHRFYIPRNEGERRPQDYVFVDVETKQEKVNGVKPYTSHSLQLGVACHVNWRKNRDPKETWFNFEYATHFWEWLKQWEKKRRILWVVAHNAQFDMTILGLWGKIEDNSYATKRPGQEYRDSRTKQLRMSENWHGLCAIDGVPFHVETHGTIGRVNFTDLQNYYNCSLATIGESVGVVKGKWDHVRQSETDLRLYCHNDVEILKRAYLGLVERWEKQHNGNWQMSAASLAYSHYRHKHMSDSIALHSHAEAMRIEWESLYGGEVRCWYRGRAPGRVIHYDVNSLYPSVMRDAIFPTALVDYILRPSRAIFRSLTDKYAAVATVDIQTTLSMYPVRKSNRTIFPVGRFKTTLAGPELLAALDSGHITHCYSLAIYTHAPIFKRYVLEWWDEKRVTTIKGDTAGVAFAKLMLNSLPAKFAQRTPSWVDEPRVDVVAPWKVFPWRDPKTKVLYTARSEGWIGKVMKERVPTDHAFPLIYAYVTAYAREYMRHVRQQLEPTGVYYQDTDSLLVSEAEAEKLDGSNGLVGERIGQLRRVGNYDEVIFRGPKNYTIDGRHTISGIRKLDIEVKEMSWSCERLERAQAIFCREPDCTIRAHVVDMDTPGTNMEGFVKDDGWCEPLELVETRDRRELVT